MVSLEIALLAESELTPLNSQLAVEVAQLEIGLIRKLAFEIALDIEEQLWERVGVVEVGLAESVGED